MLASREACLSKFKMAGRWRCNDHGLNKRVAEQQLQVRTGCDLPGKRPQVSRLWTARDHPPQVNLLAQVMQAAQMWHGPRADSDQTQS